MNDITALVFILSILSIYALSSPGGDIEADKEKQYWLAVVIKYQQIFLLLTCFFHLTESAGMIQLW